MSGELARIAVALKRDHFSLVPVSWSSALFVNRGRACFSDKQSFESPAERQQVQEAFWSFRRRKNPGPVRSWDETRAMMAERVLELDPDPLQPEGSGPAQWWSKCYYVGEIEVLLHPHFIERQEDQYGNRTG